MTSEPIPYRPESDFTPPRDDCPHPHHWHADTAGATETEVVELIGSLVRALQPDLVIETGVLHGTTTRAIGEALARNGHGRLHALEIDERYAQEAARAVAHLPVTVHQRPSTTFVPPAPIDLAFLDSSLEARPQELIDFAPYMHDRTIIVVHDTGPQHPVRASIAPVADKLGFTLLDLPTPRGLTIGRRQ
ncbi:class I SAM-dependent methyltransferase [Nocardiopsis sp. NPDC006139]|uniref:class I SAM-dependent methyltransferase n=1 Tax=Nocardiopsis sp. NPDC006139 TaxID=3154578 RepID=UPI0033A5510B